MVMDDLDLLSIEYCKLLIENKRLKNTLDVYKENQRNVDVGLVKLANYINSCNNIPKNTIKRINELLFEIK